MTSVYLTKRWCSVCQVYKESETNWCDDCHQRTRSKPRYKRKKIDT